MADTLGVGRNTASRWMHDHGVPRRAYIAQWALKTGVDLEWLEHGWAPWDSNPQPTDYVCDVLGRGRFPLDRGTA